MLFILWGKFENTVTFLLSKDYSLSFFQDRWTIFGINLICTLHSCISIIMLSRPFNLLVCIMIFLHSGTSKLLAYTKESPCILSSWSTQWFTKPTPINFTDGCKPKELHVESQGSRTRFVQYMNTSCIYTYNEWHLSFISDLNIQKELLILAYSITLIVASSC